MQIEVMSRVNLLQRFTCLHRLSLFSASLLYLTTARKYQEQNTGNSHIYAYVFSERRTSTSI